MVYIKCFCGSRKFYGFLCLIVVVLFLFFCHEALIRDIVKKNAQTRNTKTQQNRVFAPFHVIAKTTHKLDTVSTFRHPARMRTVITHMQKATVSFALLVVFF